MRTLLAKNTLIIPGKSDFPSDNPRGRKCPHCNDQIKTFKIVPVPGNNKPRTICPSCGKNIKIVGIKQPKEGA
jgi:hypothetical protein